LFSLAVAPLHPVSVSVICLPVCFALEPPFVGFSDARLACGNELCSVITVSFLRLSHTWTLSQEGSND
jgi:hypothetical protein